MTSIKAQMLQQKLQIATLHLKEQPIQTNRNFNKIATLEPYMADIQKKLKLKGKLSKNHKNKLNQSSSRSFRIKDISTASLHKLNFERIDNFKTTKLQKNKDTINTTGLLNNPKKIRPNNHNEQIQRQRKAKSQQQRHFQSSFSKTIIVRQASNLTALNVQKQPKEQRQIKICPPQGSQKDKSSSSNTFNDYFLRNNKAKDNKQQKFRKNMYEIILPKKNSVTSNSKKDSESIKKISCTQLHIDKVSKKKDSQSQQIDFLNVKKTEVVRKNNFRRGKYEMALHSSVNQNLQIVEQLSHDPLHSERLYNNHGEEGDSKLAKKESTLSINHEMDILAEREMIKFYQKVRTKQIQKSLQKSTQKYFCSDTYRPIKSKNEIEIYLSSLINPSINKTSQSTYDKDSRNKSPLDMKHNKTDFYVYDFEFEDEKSHIQNLQNKINQVMENSQQYDQSFSQTNEKEFQQQRRNAEIQYFQKQNPNIEWSDEDCQVDDV